MSGREDVANVTKVYFIYVQNSIGTTGAHYFKIWELKYWISWSYEIYIWSKPKSLSVCLVNSGMRVFLENQIVKSYLHPRV